MASSGSPELLEWYNAGVQAFQSKQYPEAIHYLQTFSQLCVDAGQMEEQTFLQTQMLLVQCYHATQQLEAAIALCEWCIQHPDLAEWASQTLLYLQATPDPVSAPTSQESPRIESSPTPEVAPPPASTAKPEVAPTEAVPVEAALAPSSPAETIAEDPNLLEAGVAANRRENHEEAVQLLTQYLGVEIAETSQKFMKAQMTLIKSHLALDQKEAAINRCRQLQNTPNAALKIWINKTLGSLVSPEELHATSKPASQASPPQASTSQAPASQTSTSQAPDPQGTPPEKPGESSSKKTITIDATPRSGASRTAASSTAPTSPTPSTVSSSVSSSSRRPVSTAPQGRSRSAKAPSTAFSPDEILPLIGAFILTLIFCFLGFNTVLGFLGRIIFFVAIAIGVGTATQGIQKVMLTGIGLFVLSIIPFTGVSFVYFIGWGIGATVMSFLLSANKSEGLIDLLNPKSIRMTIALGLGFLLAVTPSLFGIGGSPQANSSFGDNLSVEVGVITPLHIAAGQGDVTQVKTLLAASSDVNARDPVGRTPLYWAVSGCIWNTLDEFSESYQCAITPTHVEVVNLLVGASADVNAVDVYAETPLFWAVAWGSPQTVQALLTYKANPNPGGTFSSPLAVAEERGDNEIISLLKKYGAQ